MASESVRLRAGGAVARRQLASRASRYFFLGATVLGVSILVFLGYDTVVTGASRLSLDFLTNYPSRFAEKAGLRPAMFGTFWLMLITLFSSIPIAIGTAIWIEEFAPRNRLLSRHRQQHRPPQPLRPVNPRQGQDSPQQVLHRPRPRRRMPRPRQRRQERPSQVRESPRHRLRPRLLHPRDRFLHPRKDKLRVDRSNHNLDNRHNRDNPPRTRRRVLSSVPRSSPNRDSRWIRTSRKRCQAVSRAWQTRTPLRACNPRECRRSSRVPSIWF